MTQIAQKQLNPKSYRKSGYFCCRIILAISRVNQIHKNIFPKTNLLMTKKNTCFSFNTDVKLYQLQGVLTVIKSP